MKTAVLALTMLALMGCSKGPFAQIEEGKAFTQLDSLPVPYRKDAWKTLRWINLDAKPMTKDGGACTGHAGLIERDSDHQHLLVLGAVCGGTVLTTSSGDRLEAHALKTMGQGDKLTLEARFVEVMEPGVYALWTTTDVLFENDREKSVMRDNTALRRRDNQLSKLFELGNEGVLENGFEGDTFPRTFVLRSAREEQLIVFDPNENRYAHKSYRTFTPDGGAPAADAGSADASAATGP